MQSDSYVGAQLTFHYDRKQIILERSELSEGLAGKYVEALRLLRSDARSALERSFASLPGLQ